MDSRQLKDGFYAQVARIGKAVCSPKRLELLELLCQDEKPVETLAKQASISVKLASAHLKELRLAHLVETRKDGKSVYYRLASEAVADFWVAIRALAEDRLLELRVALSGLSEHAHELQPMSREELLRPSEFEAGHLPHARSMPLEELKKRLADLPRDKPVVAYCRGPFCLMAVEAVDLLRQEGFTALRLEDGVAEWRAHGLPVESA
jgi:rhodanese-related sulfurtransferase